MLSYGGPIVGVGSCLCKNTTTSPVANKPNTSTIGHQDCYRTMPCELRRQSRPFNQRSRTIRSCIQSLSMRGVFLTYRSLSPTKRPMENHQRFVWTESPVVAYLWLSKTHARTHYTTVDYAIFLELIMIDKLFVYKRPETASFHTQSNGLMWPAVF